MSDTFAVLPGEPVSCFCFRPYEDNGPHFTLRTWRTGRHDSLGKVVLGYSLTEVAGRRIEVLFTGEDFACSPCHAPDSPETVAALMGFLTLRPGDTDPEYFEEYTDRQWRFCCEHAETLAWFVPEYLEVEE